MKLSFWQQKLICKEYHWARHILREFLQTFYYKTYRSILLHRAIGKVDLIGEKRNKSFTLKSVNLPKLQNWKPSTEFRCNFRNKTQILAMISQKKLSNGVGIWRHDGTVSGHFVLCHFNRCNFNRCNFNRCNFNRSHIQPRAISTAANSTAWII